MLTDSLSNFLLCMGAILVALFVTYIIGIVVAEYKLSKIPVERRFKIVKILRGKELMEYRIMKIRYRPFELEWVYVKDDHDVSDYRTVYVRNAQRKMNYLIYKYKQTLQKETVEDVDPKDIDAIIKVEGTDD